MKKSTLISIGVIFLVLGALFPVSAARAADNNRPSFYGTIYDQVSSIKNRYLHSSSGALKAQTNSQIIKAKTNLLVASTLLKEFTLGGAASLQDLAQSIIQGASQYFDEAYTSDNDGWVSNYDFSKAEVSYVKSQKYTHDQFLMMLGLALSHPILSPDNEYKYDYMEAIAETLGFLNRHLEGNISGWVDSLFTINRTSYSKNHFRIIENICWTIWAILNLPDSIESPLSLTTISQVMDLIDSNGTFNGAVFNVLDPGWDSSDNVLKLKTNALYGIINLMLYEKTSNSEFLTRGRAVYDFLREFMYDRGFGGFFDVVDKEGMLVVQRKSVIGNSLVCLLSSKLLKYDPENKSIETTIVRTNRFIETNLYNSQLGLYYITCERTGLPLTQYSLMSDAIRLWQRQNSLHIINGSIPLKVSFGESVKLTLNLFNPDNLTYSLWVQGQDIIPFNISSHESSLQISLNLKDTAQAGYSDINIDLKVLSGLIDKRHSLQLTIGSDRRLPQGLMYIIALGILVGIVIVVRYPPRSLEDLMNRLSAISAIEEDSGESSSTESIPDQKTPK